jgi:hypothetical protein
MAEKRPIEIPTPAALRQAARARATEIAPTLVGADKEEVQGLAANRTDLGNSLNLVPREIETWVRNHRDRAVGEIALARRVRFAASADLGRPDPHFPLGPLSRASLGDALARDLLEEAEHWRGRADSEGGIAKRLAGVEPAALPALRKTVEKLEKAAEARAAGMELERRALIESAREAAADGMSATFTPTTPPLDAHAAVLGNRGEILKRYSSAIADQLASLDGPTLSHLALATEAAWSEQGFDRGVTREIGYLERDREVAWRERLEALRRVGAGERPELSQTVADARLKKMREIDYRLRQAREQPGDVGRLVSDDSVRAALHAASHQVLAERAAEIEKAAPSPAVEADLGGPSL